MELGVLDDDREVERCLEEAAQVTTDVSRIREMLAFPLSAGEVTDPRCIFEDYMAVLAEDYLRSAREVRLTFLSLQPSFSPQTSCDTKPDALPRSGPQGSFQPVCANPRSLLHYYCYFRACPFKSGDLPPSYYIVSRVRVRIHHTSQFAGCWSQ